MYDFLDCNYRPSKLPMHESDVGRDYKDLDECAIFSKNGYRSKFCGCEKSEKSQFLG